MLWLDIIASTLFATAISLFVFFFHGVLFLLLFFFFSFLLKHFCRFRKVMRENFLGE